MSALPHTFPRPSRPAFFIRNVVLVSVLGAGIAQGASAEPPKPVGPPVSAAAPAATLQLAAIDPRWSASMEAFAAADLRQAPQPGGVVFVGSSSIRMWNDLETSFADHPVVIKRGFGGSQLIDCVKLVHRLVLPYKPRLVVVYAGENDLAEGVSPWAVTQRFADFVQSVKAELPQARIAFVSIKPSPSRAGMLAAVRETNAMIKAYSQIEAQLDFIDVFSPMLGADGQPRPELFLGDRLHLNADGYTIWQRVIAQHLKS